MIASLRDMEHLGLVGPTDVALARALARLGGAAGEAELECAVALASRLVSMGHVCLALDAPPEPAELAPDATGGDSATVEMADWSWPDAGAWAEALRATRVVGEAGEEPVRPLVLDARGRLYLRRFFEHEQRLASALLARACTETEVDEAVLADGLTRLFGDVDGEGDEGRASAGQRRAAEASLRRRLCVVSGGPGTGKTSTVARILVLAVEQARGLGYTDPRISLIAPTGKAAAALSGALARNLESIACDETVRAAIPRVASTIHRALGPRGGVGAGFRHDAEQPLAADFVVVDEASMVDLGLMRRLVDAVPTSATLVMMGDADQLASVEAGAVLADVCGDAGERARGGPLEPAIVRLTHSYRFSADSGIGGLSQAVRVGDVAAAEGILADEGRADVTWIEREEGIWPAAMLEFIDEGREPLRTAETPEAAVTALARFRVLTPHRVGPFGVEALNRRLGARSRSAGARFEPVLVERNDPAVGLWNGDMGVRQTTMPVASSAQVYFEPDDRGGPLAAVRSLSELRLPPHSPCWAMSVHKSQGSEFDAVLVVLPDRTSPVLTREMLYTAITRARERVIVWGPREVLAECIERRVERHSGLRDLLWGDAD